MGTAHLCGERECRPANGVVLDDDPERSVALAPCGHIDFRSGKA
ncbi:MAG TPA: hypothetical protein VE466_06055 [Acidimicrobiales bacterium]|nr:hypothetical protein [Acidimicrobiales bacterium]